jgi:hypothetical protein
MPNQRSQRAKPKRRTEAEWRQIFIDQENSNLTQRAYCHENGIILSTYYNWRQRINNTPAQNKRQQTKPATDLFIEVPVQPHTQIPPSLLEQWKIELDLGDGICLRLSKTQ